MGRRKRRRNAKAPKFPIFLYTIGIALIGLLFFIGLGLLGDNNKADSSTRSDQTDSGQVSENAYDNTNAYVSGKDNTDEIRAGTTDPKANAPSAEQKTAKAKCDGLRKIPEKRLCYAALGATYADIELCKGTDDDSAEGCKGAIYAKNGKETSECISNACLMGYGYGTEDVETCNQLDYEAAQANCLYGFAWKTQDATYCDGTSLQDSCYWFFAQKLKDATYCEKSGFEKEDCLFRFIVKDSKIRGITKEVCNDISVEHRSFCYALEEKDPNLCELAEEFEYDCYSRLASAINDISLCEKAGESKEYCLWNMAVNNGNVSICDELSGKKDVCYSDVALKNKDISLCEHTGTMKEACLFNVLTSMDMDASTCESLSNKDQCYFTMAQKNEDTSFCDKSERYKEYCYALVAQKSIDSELCSESGKHQDVCLLKLAVATQNPILCTDTSYKEACILDIVKRAVDPASISDTICTEAGEFKELCYYELALKKKDATLCNKAGDFKEDCLQKRDIGVGTDTEIPKELLTNTQDAPIDVPRGVEQ
jgi:hypothetical protein